MPRTGRAAPGTRGYRALTPAALMTRADSTASGSPTRFNSAAVIPERAALQAIGHRYVLRLESNPGGLGLQQQQLREVVFGHATTDERLHNIVRE